VQRFLHDITVQLHQFGLSLQQRQNVTPGKAVIVIEALINRTDESEIF
jgi:hypothetical protein